MEDFASLVKKVEGYDLWKIVGETVAMERSSDEAVGSFDISLNDGDVYLLLVTIRIKEEVYPGSETRKLTMKWNLHRIFGAFSCPAEQIVAFNKSNDLHHYLRHLPQHYQGPYLYDERQGFEHDFFKAYFSEMNSLNYVHGGGDTFLQHVETNAVQDYVPKLYCVRNTGHIQMDAVKPEAASINQTDVFILDIGLKIFVYLGPFSRVKNVEFMMKYLINQTNSNPDVEIDYLQSNLRNETFWDALGETAADPLRLSLRYDSSFSIAGDMFEKTLYKITDNGRDSPPDVSIVAKGDILSRNMLCSGDSYILLAYDKVFAWSGLMSSSDGKLATSKKAHEFSGSLCYEREGMETDDFIKLFETWDPIRIERPLSQGGVELVVNVSRCMQEYELDSSIVINDLKIWVITINENGLKDVTEIELSSFGHFYSDQSYILLCKYTKGEVQKHHHCVLYFWLGEDDKDKGACSVLATQLSKSNDLAPTVRVVQGKEPQGFRRLFQGHMIVFQAPSELTSDDISSSTSVYRVHGEDATCAVATQLSVHTLIAFSSDECIILIEEGSAFVIRGKRCSDDFKTNACVMASMLTQLAIVIVDQESESDSFWDSINRQIGIIDYSTILARSESRLFILTLTKKSYVWEEIVYFIKADLEEHNDGVMLLDTSNSVYLWYGENVSPQMRKDAKECAAYYVMDSEKGDGFDLIEMVDDSDSYTTFMKYFT